MQRVSHSLRLSLGAILAAGFFAASPAYAAKLTPVEEANKQAVLDFYAALNKADAEGTAAQSIQATAEKYLSPNYTQHSANMKNLPGAGTDRDKLIRMFQTMPPRPANAPPMAPQKLESIMAEGDLVMMLVSRTPADPSGKAQPSYIFNMFRVKDGKLVDHWDVSPSMAGGAPPGGGGPGAPRP